MHDKIPAEIYSLTEELSPYNHPLGHIMPPLSIIQDLEDRVNPILTAHKLTPLAIYCYAAVDNASNVQLLAKLLGA